MTASSSTSLFESIQTAISAGQLEPSVEPNLHLLWQQGEGWVQASISELVEKEAWTELNDRFYKTLAFGTGGLRGRTIGKIVPQAEQGKGGTNGAPEHAAAGTNAMNDFNVSRATQGIIRYLRKCFSGTQPKVVIAHDSRYFSRHFTELAAQVVSSMGGIAYVFPEERSTPELSFAVRHLSAHAGVMITASHNPPHDNGYKVYFQDGAQIVEPHASAIIQEVMGVTSGQVTDTGANGKILSISTDVDAAYLDVLDRLVLEPEMLREQSKGLKIVYTPLHGTGIKMTPPMLARWGMKASVPAQQAMLDGRFPTVKSPNPENAEAFTLALEMAKAEKADLVFATDPDADRMGIAVRGSDGQYEMLTGNQIGSLMSSYRLERLVAQGVITSENSKHAALIKTFVTTDLIQQVAAAYGVKCVNTLTGFKYIGEKLRNYEEQAGGRNGLDFKAWRDERLKKSTFFVFGSEESYGYSGSDEVRDKDAQAAVLMAIEAAAFARSKGQTLLDRLNELYLKHGLYRERLGTLTFEGSEGAAKIKKLLESYEKQPPVTWGRYKVEKVENFAKETFYDVDGKKLPSELMLMFSLQDGFRIAVRGSGTEPKIKYYFFGRESVPSADALPKAKSSLVSALDTLWEQTQQDVNERVKS